MTRHLVSKKTRNEFREYFVGTTLREIEDAFDAADVSHDASYEPSVSGQRRTLVEQYYHTIDWKDWSLVQRALRVFEGVLMELEAALRTDGLNQEYIERTYHLLVGCLRRDGFSWESGRITPLAGPQLHELGSAAVPLDLPGLATQIERVRSSVDTDPGLAIGTAKDLLETTCRSILRERGVPQETKWDLGQLIKETRRSLSLLPADIPNEAKGSESIRRLLSNLGAVTQGLAELRNLDGSGHGRDGRHRGVLPRHARLAVGAATTLATFLVETHLATREDAV